MKLRFLLDTNIVSAAFTPEPPPGLLDRLDRHGGGIAIAAPVWHELLFGRDLLPPSRRRKALTRYLEDVVLASYPVLAYDGQAAEWHAGQRARLTRAGRPPAFVDGQIAAVAYVNDLVLVTDNVADFEPFDGLRMVNWLERG